MTKINILTTRILCVVLAFFILVTTGCSDSNYPQQARYDLNNDGYSDLIVGSFGGYGGSQDHVYIFYGGVSGLNQTPGYKFRYDQHNAFTAGDINGDGYTDLIIAVNKYNVCTGGAGGVYIHLGSGSGLSTTPDVVLDGGIRCEYSVNSLSLANINGDRYLDLIVGVGARGEVSIYLGTETGVDSRVWRTIRQDSVDSQFGETVAVGDVNGDGNDDLAVGAAGSKRIFVYMGTAFNIDESPSVILDTTSKYMLNSITSSNDLHILLKDMNLDGYSDLIICDRKTQERICSGDQSCGVIVHNKVAVSYGGKEGLESSPTIVAQHIYTYSDQIIGLPYGINGPIAVGDINADGYPDLAIGLRNGVLVYMGSDVGIDETNSQTIFKDNNFGYTLAFTDFNSDGFSDLSVSSIGFNTGQSIEARGQVYIYDGDATGLIDLPLVLEGENPGDRFGYFLPQ